MFLLKKLILWFLGAFLIAGSAFFLTPVPEKAEETAASVSAQESAEKRIKSNACLINCPINFKPRKRAKN